MQIYLDYSATTPTRPEAIDAMQQHLANYVSYYSVYQDVVLVSPDGQIQLRLDQSKTQKYSRDPLVQQCLQRPQQFSETFRYSDLQPEQKQNRELRS